MSSSPQLVCVNDYEKKAISILDANARGYYQSGADDEQTLHDNVADFKKYVMEFAEFCLLKHHIYLLNHLTYLLSS